MQAPQRPSLHEELRRRAHRFGRIIIAMSIVGGVLIGSLSRATYGLFVGALVFALGLYVYFAFVPLARWLAEREQSS
jgi:hypothetical protein